MSLQNRQISRPKPAKDWVTVILVIVFLVLAIAAGLVAFNVARQFFLETKIINMDNTLPIMPTASDKGTKTAQDAAGTTQTTETPTVAELAPMEPATMNQEWNGTDRVTVLVMGLDYRDWSTGVDVPRTDTMILLSIDPLNKTAGMLSIPRDMWVNIPGFGYHRINTAYPLGEGSKLPGGGAGLAMKTVEQFVGVPVDYAALVDFNSFVKFIDTLGGLDMYIREEITVDPVGQGNTKKLKVGVQALDGASVLAYARMRYTKDGDFDRSKRQQEVIMALRDQIVEFNQLPMLVSKAPQLYKDLSSGIRTNMTLDQAIQLAWLATKIDPNNIKKGVFDPHMDINYVTAQTKEGVQDVLVPVPDRIRLLRDQVFVSGGQYGPSANTGSLADLMKSENARVIIKNGTTQAGIAAKASELLRSLGMNIVSEAAADKAYSNTTIVNYTGKPYTVKFLVDTFKVKDARIVDKFDPNSPVDIEINVGSDWTGQ
jgi:polyisoprenyl-teichoic acid--peptidoglycan teichoic acid transferase